VFDEHPGEHQGQRRSFAATEQIVGLSKLPTSETFTVLVSDGLGDGSTEVLTLSVA